MNSINQKLSKIYEDTLDDPGVLPKTGELLLAASFLDAHPEKQAEYANAFINQMPNAERQQGYADRVREVIG